MITKRLFRTVLFCLAFAALFSAWTPASPNAIGPQPGQPQPILVHEVLAKAQPDECFHGIGAPYDPDPTCSSSPGTPKVNQAYVWGLVEANQMLWFGTAPNVLCSVFGGFLGVTEPMQTDSWVCEFGSSTYPSNNDLRMPQIFTYDLATKTLTEKTPLADPNRLIQRTGGLRSAGALDGVVLLGGPGAGGINLFAYDALTGDFLGSANFPQYNNIRKWIVVNGALYAGVGKPGGGGGAVIRWTGSLANPLQIEEVGRVDSDAAEVMFHQNRLFVNTWPSLGGANPKPATVWMSPVIPAGGLTTADVDTPWKKIFSMDQYDPDPLTAVMTGGGAMASYGGYLYWGTMHVPFMSGIYHMRLYGTPDTTQGVLQTLLGSHRAISIFRGKNLGAATQRIELLYGEALMTAYIPGEGWKLLPNKMKTLPKYGPSGFGNPFNNYTWSMAIYNNQLYVGTMDWSYLLREGLSAYVAEAYDIPFVDYPVKAQSFGADLWRFPSIYMPAKAESIDGIGNYSSYGVRNLITGDGVMYAGMANPMNLMTDPSTGPLGGWELIQLKKP